MIISMRLDISRGFSGAISLARPPMAKISKEQRNARCLRRWGHEYTAHRAIQWMCFELGRNGVSINRQPIGAYQRHRTSAKKRGIEWQFTFAQWWAFWQQSGKWEKRGRGEGYVMGRFGDAGPYNAENCYITKAGDNVRHYMDRRLGRPSKFSTPKHEGACP